MISLKYDFTYVIGVSTRHTWGAHTPNFFHCKWNPCESCAFLSAFTRCLRREEYHYDGNREAHPATIPTHTLCSPFLLHPSSLFASRLFSLSFLPSLFIPRLYFLYSLPSSSLLFPSPSFVLPLLAPSVFACGAPS